MWDSRNNLALAATLFLVVIMLLPIAALLINVFNVDLQLPTNISISSLIILFINSLLFSASVTFFSLLFGVLLALGIAKTNLAFKKIWLLLFTLPLFIPTNIQAIIWSDLFGQYTGINQLLMHLLNQNETSMKFNAWFSAGWVQLISYYPIVLLSMCAGFIHWDKQWSEASLFYHHNKKLQILLMWRYYRNYIGISALLVFIFSFSDFAVADLFQVHVYATEIFLQLSAYLNISGAIITSLPMLAVGLLMLYWLYHWLEQIPLTNKVSHNHQIVLYSVSNSTQIVLNICFSILSLVMIIIPMFVLIYQIDSWHTIQRAILATWKDISVSVFISLMGSMLILLFSLIIAYVIQRKIKPANQWMRLALLFTLILPSSVIGIAYINLWNSPYLPDIFYQKGLIIPLALCLVFLPLAVEIMILQFKKIPQSMEQAAFVCRINLITSLRITLLPSLLPSIKIIGALCFIFCFNELTTTLLIAPPGISILPVRLFSMVHYGPQQLVAALSLIQLTILSLPVFLLFKYNRNFLGNTTNIS